MNVIKAALNAHLDYINNTDMQKWYTLGLILRKHEKLMWGASGKESRELGEKGLISKGAGYPSLQRFNNI